MAESNVPIERQVGFLESLSLFFKNYLNFSGRSGPSAYWWYLLWSLIFTILFAQIDSLALDISAEDLFSLSSAFALITLIPSISLSFRRLHDIDKSGWWLLISLIPLIGVIILIFWFATKSDEGINRFGDHYVFKPSENTQTSKSEIPHVKLDSNTCIGISGFDSSGAVVRLMIDNYNANEIVYIIGRNSKECDLVLNDSSVSRKHAEITVEDNGTFIKDLSSANGTMINNKILEPEVKTILPDSGALTIGSSELVIFRG